ncbi:MAG: SpoIVB peptidase [Bacillota bacterium]
MKKRLAFLLILVVCFTFLFIPFQENAQAWDNDRIAWSNKDEFVYLGGSPLGITAYADGIIVSDYAEVFSEEGMSCPSKESGILIGDMIIAIDKKKIKTVEEMIEYLNKKYKSNKQLELEILRNDQKKTIAIKPAKDRALNQYKLGIMVKSDIAGVGTLTYVVPERNRFAGLGHKIYDSSLPQQDVYKKGLIYPCSIIGTVKGKQGKAGELKGYFEKNGEDMGYIDKNNDYGIFGYFEDFNYKQYPLIELGSKKDVTPGKAYVYTSVKGSVPKRYEIEIVKNLNQQSPAQKGLVIRVTDKELLDVTAGIVQGMSGSPIVQNQKLIGAVTHVFINDPTKGYGMYIDWMINN